MDPARKPRDAVVVLGPERHGLTAAETAACDLAATIPAPGFASLDVSAAAVLASEARA